MSSVSGISSSYASNYSDISATNRRQRPDPAKMAEDLFSQLDTSGKGYIQESDLESALSGLKSTNSTQSASEIFSRLDSDSDGKVTKDELSTSIKKMAEELDSQFNQMRMQGGTPPPPPSGTQKSDSGFTKDELTSQLSEIGSSDSARSSLISKVVENFDKADTNGDGKVSFQEAMAYDQSTKTSSSTDSSSTSTSSDSSTTTAKTDAQVFRQLMELLRTYGNDGQSDKSTLSSLLSVSA
jgi:Ca2+-binding EF-hand superfamily protein